MSSSDGEGPGQKPKQPASSTLAGMPPPKDAPGAPAPSRAPLPPPKAPPGGRPHSTSTSPPPLPSRPHSSTSPPPPGARSHSPSSPPPGGPTPLSGPHALPGGPNPLSGPHALPGGPNPLSGPHSLPGGPNPLSGPHTLPGGPNPPSGPHALPPQTAPRGFPAQPSVPQPFAAPPGNPIASQHQPAFVQSGPVPTQPGLGAFGHAPQPGDSMEEVPGSQFVKFLKISSRRAFRLRIEPGEVLPSERASLERASPPILDSNLQAFLAWRRSVLFLVASRARAAHASSASSTRSPAASRTPIRIVQARARRSPRACSAWICWIQLKQLDQLAHAAPPPVLRLAAVHADAVRRVPLSAAHRARRDGGSNPAETAARARRRRRLPARRDAVRVRDDRDAPARAEGDLADARPDPRVARDQAAVPRLDGARLADRDVRAALRAARVRHPHHPVPVHRQRLVHRRRARRDRRPGRARARRLRARAAARPRRRRSRRSGGSAPTTSR